jgi:hypothetical protein
MVIVNCASLGSTVRWLGPAARQIEITHLLAYPSISTPQRLCAVFLSLALLSDMMHKASSSERSSVANMHRGNAKLSSPILTGCSSPETRVPCALPTSSLLGDIGFDVVVQGDGLNVRM